VLAVRDIKIDPAGGTQIATAADKAALIWDMATGDLLSQLVVVQVVDAGPKATPEVYLNSKATSWNRLGSDLKDELKLRPEWVVYVEADPNLPWADAATVIDVAKGLHARVVLLTVKPALRTGHAREASKPKRQ